MDFNSSFQTISWFRDRYREGSLEIRPPFQRKPVWAIRQKCYLIESILMNLPVPEIYIQQTTTAEGDTTYAIVDGQQRIRTVLQFTGAESDPQEEEYNKFVLDKIDPNSQWSNITFGELSDEEKKAFYGYKFAVRYLNTENNDEISDMFKRLNKFLTPLKPQELRNAMFSGPFIELAEKLSDDEYWSENRIVSPALIRRMGDVEFVSDLLIGVLHGPQGGSAKILDDYYQQYEDYEDEFPGQRPARRLFNQTLEKIQLLLPDIKEYRWGNKTDFYTLFVGMAALLRSRQLLSAKHDDLTGDLLQFAQDIDQRMRNDREQVSGQTVQYVRSVQKGANDKRRRADRHAALIDIIGRYFE